MERAISAPSCLGRSARVRSLMASSPVPSLPPRSWRMSGHLSRSSASMGRVYANRMNDVSENDWKTFVEQRRAAAKAEREWLKENPTTPQQAIALSLELLNIYESLHGNPFVKDEITR